MYVHHFSTLLMDKYIPDYSLREAKEKDEGKDTKDFHLE
jgi:hypothetical protein